MASPSAAAKDGETVSMALACTSAGDRLHIDKADEQVYPIIGAREEQTLRVCSGPAGGRCQYLRIYKFKFDCAGKPVEWVNAAAKAARGEPWKAKLTGSRMTLHFWPHGPGAHRRRPLALPPGFAPPPAGGLRFSSPGAVPDESARAAQSPDDLTQAQPIRFEPRRALEGEARAGEPAPPRPTAIVSLREPDPAAADVPPDLVSPASPGWSATAIIGTSEMHQVWWRRLVPAAVPDVVLAGIGIAALLLSATVVAARQQGGHRVPANELPSLDPSDPSSGAHAARASADENLPVRPFVHDPAPDDNADPVAELASALRDVPSPAPPSGDWASVTAMQSTADDLLDRVRQAVAEHVPDGAMRDVLVTDLAVIASRLEGPELADALASRRTDQARSIYTQAILDLERARTLSHIERERALRVTGGEHRAPETVEDACAFLGVNPRASEAVVKKVVDALRQNWHPDHAGDEADRRTREERIKHINAAWDLIRVR